MLKYLTKIAMDILPSVVATVIGAYIVNHYISNKAPTDAPAAAVSTVDPGKATGSIPEPGIKAKGISEKGMIEKTASERPAEVKPTDVKAADAKSSDGKPVDAAPAEGRFHLFSHDKPKAEKATPEKEKAVAKATPAPAASPAPAVNPLAEASASPTEDHRDAAELARSALERLRDKNPESKAAEAKASEKAQTEKEAARAEPPKVQEQPRTVAAVPPVIRPLPPPITVSTPQPEQAASAQPSYPPYTASVRTDDPNRPTPPADIPPPPAQPPLDLRADAGAAGNHARNMAEDMLSAAKSVFHAVIPTPSQKIAD